MEGSPAVVLPESLCVERKSEDGPVGAIWGSPKIRTREVPEESIPALRKFSDYSNPTTVALLCFKNVPGWAQSLPGPDCLLVVQLCEGLSNQLFKATVPKGLVKEFYVPIETVLFRVYGRQVQLLYDPEEELRVFKALAEYAIAPKMFANGDGWRIEVCIIAIASSPLCT